MCGGRSIQHIGVGAHGPAQWSRRLDEGHPGAFVSTRVVRSPSGMSSGGKRGVGRQAPTKAAEKSDYELQRDARIAQNQAFLASLGLGAAQSPQKSRAAARPGRRSRPRGSRRASAPRPCSPASTRRRRNGGRRRRSRGARERAAGRAAKFLKRADKAAAGAAAADAREYLRFARFLAERPVARPRRLCCTSGGRARAGLLRAIPRGRSSGSSARAPTSKLAAGREGPLC